MIFLNCLVISYLVFSYCEALIDPVSITVGAGVLAGLYNFDFVKRNTYCQFTECCNDNYIPGNIEELKRKLNSKLFGQHIVINQLVPALRAHFSKDANSKKALVLSFHGTPGTGKNYAAEFIAKSLYKNGLESKYVHIYKGRADFSLQSHSHTYAQRIRREVMEAVKDCPRSLFIFDEVDKMPHGIFEALTSLVDYNSRTTGANFKHLIFIFLSNTAGVDISLHLGELMRTGKLREEAKMSDFEKILEMGAYNLDGGMKKTSLIEAHVIDHYIPFLPLEKKHVEECLKAEFLRWDRLPQKDVIESIITNSVSFEKKTGLFATSGCKTLDKKVAVEVKSF